MSPVSLSAIICVTLSYQDIKVYRGTLFMTLYPGMMPARLWRVTVVIVIKGAENGLDTLDVI